MSSSPVEGEWEAAIGGGNVLCTICDLAICPDRATFGHAGPKMGSVDPAYGAAFLARVVWREASCERSPTAIAIAKRSFNMQARSPQVREVRQRLPPRFTRRRAGAGP